MKKIIYLAAAFLCMACSDDHESDQQHGGASGSVTEVTPVTSDLSVGLSTDKAFYKPGEKVVFTADNALPAGTKVRYRLSGETVGEESVNGTGWGGGAGAPRTACACHRFQRIHGRGLPSGKWHGCDSRHDCGRCIQ